MSKFGQYNFNLARRAHKFCNNWAAQFWHHEPLPNGTHADEQQYKTLWETERQAVYPEIDAFEQTSGYSLDKDWMDDLALNTQITVKSSPVCYQHGRILYAGLRQYLQNHSDINTLRIFETGTARGFSSTIMAKALQDHKRAGSILTFDLLPHKKPIFWNNHLDHSGKRTRADLLKPWADLIKDYIIYVEGDIRLNLNKIETDRIHFSFLDAGHSYRDVRDEFSMLSSRQDTGDITVFDDYNKNDFPGVVQAVDEGCSAYGYDKTVITCGRDRAYVIATKL